MTEWEWREQLKAGAKVLVDKPFGYPPVVGKVSRTTKTRVMVECNPWKRGTFEYTFSKDQGFAIPYSPDGLRLSPPKPEPSPCA